MAHRTLTRPLRATPETLSVERPNETHVRNPDTPEIQCRMWENDRRRLPALLHRTDYRGRTGDVFDEPSTFGIIESTSSPGNHFIENPAENPLRVPRLTVAPGVAGENQLSVWAGMTTPAIQQPLL